MTKRIDDGFKTLLTFAAQSNVKMYEKSVTPVGVEAGGANDTTTMRNTTWRTKAPKKLKSLTDGSATVAYDPAVLPQIIAMVGVNQLITTTFPDGDTWAFWGWVDAFNPGEITEGEQPTADIVIIASNQDNSGVEQPPVHTPAA
jgi:hypothetical protein